MTGRIPTAAKKIALLLISVCIGACLAEIGLRIFDRDDIVLFPRYQTGAQYGMYVIRRNIPLSEYDHTSSEGRWHFITNARGFRNTYDCGYERPLHGVRIISIGDSQTFGYEVSQDETFSARLESILSRRAGVAQVLNAGVSGFGTAEELVFLENEAVKYHPDYVVLGFFRNDFDDNLKSHLFSLQGDTLVPQQRTYIPGVAIQDALYRWTLVRWLGEHSYAYSFVFNTVWNYFKEALRVRSQSEAAEYAINIHEDIGAYQQRLTLKLLERFYRACEARNIVLIMVDIPSWMPNGQCTSSLEGLVSDSGPRLYDHLISYREIVSHVDAGQIVRRRGNHHITEQTHAYIADACAQFIRSQAQ